MNSKNGKSKLIVIRTGTRCTPGAHFTKASAIVVIVGIFAFAFPARGQSPKEQAWAVLQGGAANTSAEQRADTMRALQLIQGDPKAVALVEKGLMDKEPSVRGAAAMSLGVMKSKSSIPKLEASLRDPEGAVVMAAASALIQLGDEKGYSVYYAMVTGQRKSGDSLVGGEEKELDTLMKNPKQMTEMAFEQGIGYAPFGGVALGAYQAIHSSKENVQMVKATAVRKLAKDPDPRSEKALVAATTDSSWLVRAAAFDALAQRGDSGAVSGIQPGLSDEKDVVKLAAAAAIVQLSK
jgi:HEAT repeat protein